MSMGRATRTDEFDLTIPDHSWESTDDHRLLATLYINGIPHHLEAIEVDPDQLAHESGGFIQPVNDAFSDSIDAMGVINGGEAYFHTTMINGKPYVLNMTPYT